MSAVFASLVPVALLVGLGVLLKRTLVPEEVQWAGFERIAYWVLIPALLGEKVYSADLDSVPLSALALALIGAIFAMAVIVVLVKWPLNAADIDDRSYSSVFQTSTRWNGYIALAVIAPLSGNEGMTLIAVAMAAMIPVINVENVIALTLWGTERPKNRLMLLVVVVSNPLIWSTVGGLLLNLLDVPIPEGILAALRIAGAGALGATLMIVGAGLDLATVFRPSLPVAVAVLLKLAVMPTLVFGFGLATGLTGSALQAAVLCGAVPTALNGYVLARQMGGDAPLYARIASVQTLLAFFTIPAALWLAGQFSG
ncbi:MAG: AEC family transporter [Hyphomicrobiales bacterium]|nr:AEC family transporter [Hyphomicrobiales bacterium]